jgi:hypothetical protein
MPDSIKQARVETSDERRLARRDPRAEPESDLPPDGEERRTPPPQRLDVTGVGPHTLSVRTPPESVTRAAAVPRIESMPLVEEAGAPPARRSLEPSHPLDAAGASGIAALRRQLATLQLQLSDTQVHRAREQEERAADAEELARVLVLLSTSESTNQTLVAELDRERAFVEELRVSVREKYEDCNSLRQKLTEAEGLLANALERAADRNAVAERAERSAGEVADLSARLEATRASEEAARAEIAALTGQLGELRRAHQALEVELAKANTNLKNVNMKAFAANKQLESWKSESQRTMEQTRIEQEAALSRMTEQHAKASEDLQRRAEEASTLAATLQKQAETVTEKLALTAKSLDALEEIERQVHGLREQARTGRRTVLEQFAQARRSLLGPLQPTTVAGAPAKPARPAQASLAPAPPPAPSASATRGSDAPALEISEIEMGTDDLVMELIEARKRDGL